MSSYPVGSVFKVTRYDSDEDIVRNLTLMKENGLTTVVIWPAAFWWEEKTEQYPFRTGRFILEEAEKLGLSVIMELAGQLSPMEYVPDYLVKPEYHTYKLDGGRERHQSSFGVLNYFHPEVKKLITDHYRKAALAYKDCKALLGYDVFNETMYRSFDPWTMEEFRVWLREKYGTIDRLNEVWERTYSDFSQIEFENWKWMSIMPQADYCMFRKDAIGRFLKYFCEAIREVDPVHPLIADNIHSQVTPAGSYDRPQDDYGLAEAVDEIGMSFYPKGVGGCMEPALRWEVFDGYYDACGRKGFYISEMQTHVQALFNPTTCVRRYELKQWCMEAYAAGAKALIYWMWRPFDKGLQTLGRGLVNYQGIPTERLQLAGELQKTFSKYGAVRPERSRIGLLYEPINEDFQRRLTDSYSVEQNIYVKSIFGAYKALFDRNVHADIIRLSEIENYEAVILTQNIVVTAAMAETLRDFVEKGGKLLIDGKFGIVDETSEMHRVLPGGPVNDLIGEVFFDTDNEDNTILGGACEELSAGFMGRDFMRVEDARILASFPDGAPAAVRKATGQGSVTMVNTSIFYGYACGAVQEAGSYALRLLREAGMEVETTATCLHTRLADTELGKVAFVFNYTDREVTETLKLDVNGGIVIKSVEIPAHEVQILELF